MDLVERLRDKKYPFCTEDSCYNESLMEDAADEIERLRKRVAELEEKTTKRWEPLYPDDGFGGYPSVYNRR